MDKLQETLCLLYSLHSALVNTFEFGSQECTAAIPSLPIYVPGSIEIIVVSKTGNSSLHVLLLKLNDMCL